MKNQIETRKNKVYKDLIISTIVDVIKRLPGPIYVYKDLIISTIVDWYYKRKVVHASIKTL